MTPEHVPNWRDEHPNRYGPITDGDWCVMQGFPDGMSHFVRVRVRKGRVRPVGKRTACGLRIPNWRLRRQSHRLAGQVTCSGCVVAYMDAVAP